MPSNSLPIHRSANAARRLALCVALLVASAAAAQDTNEGVDLTQSSNSARSEHSRSSDEAPRSMVTGGQGWSVQSAKTVGSGQTVLVGKVGWPGLSLGVLHGLMPKLDVGARFSFNYAFEGMTYPLWPGLKLQGLLRLAILEGDRVNLGLTFEPGPYFYFGPSTVAGLALPVGFVLGLPISSALTLNIGIDVPLHVRFGPFGDLHVPILGGAGAEYFIDHGLAVTLNTRMGPTLVAYRTATFTFEALLGVAWKL